VEELGDYGRADERSESGARRSGRSGYRQNMGQGEKLLTDTDGRVYGKRRGQKRRGEGRISKSAIEACLAEEVTEPSNLLTMLSSFSAK
jgi:hypothetical protein